MRRGLLMVWVLALCLRLAAAGAVQFGVLGHREVKGRFVFGDSDVYWALGSRLAAGETYDYGSHRAIRTPGYPFFLATIIALCGEGVFAVRIAQALVGSLVCVPVYYLGCRWFGGRAGLLGALLSAVDPYLILCCGLVVTETLFSALLILVVLTLAALGREVRWGRSSLAGGLSGLAILVRPSFLFLIPAGWLICAWRFRRRKTWMANLSIALAVSVLVLVPWWVWTYYRTGAVVLTTTKVGASLYDGLGPQATGASDMRFLSEGRPDWGEMAWDTYWNFTERENDAYWGRQARHWAFSHPGHVVRLAGVKFLKFWSPWPTARTLRNPLAKVVGVLWVLPMYVLVGYGLWRFRRHRSAMLLLVGPAAYFTLLHMIFVSSIRYRIVTVPGLLVLAAAVLASRFPERTDRPAASSLQPGRQATDND